MSMPATKTGRYFTARTVSSLSDVNILTNGYGNNIMIKAEIIVMVINSESAFVGKHSVLYKFFLFRSDLLF